MILKKKNEIKILSIGDNKVIDDFFDLLKVDFNCNYMTYMIENGNKKIYFSSNSEWRKLLTEEKLMNHCPIYKNAFHALKNSNSVFTAWDFVKHKRGMEREINELRTSLDIAHGLGLALKHDSARESIVFAGNKNDILFHERIANKSLINKALQTLRRETSCLS